MKDLRLTVPPFLLTVLQFLQEHMELLWVWMSIMVWEASTGASIPAEMKWSLYGGAFIGASFWNWRREVLRAQAAEEALAAEMKKSSPVRTFVEDADALIDRYGDTGMLTEKVLVPYLGQWVRVSGAFDGAADALVGDAIYLSLVLECGRRIHLRFPIEARERLRLLQEGQQLMAACQIRHGYGVGVFALENCELIRVEPINSLRSRRQSRRVAASPLLRVPVRRPA
jgi:hypothetical protein